MGLGLERLGRRWVVVAWRVLDARPLEVATTPLAP
jgi:hypothetical protein